MLFFTVAFTYNNLEDSFLERNLTKSTSRFEYTLGLFGRIWLRHAVTLTINNQQTTSRLTVMSAGTEMNIRTCIDKA